MRLYRIGDDGEPVRDIQSRLAALGFSCAPDPPGRYASGTEASVAGFQRARGLPADGIVGADTWRTLVDAGHVLGSRMLYHRVPMMRGDDVAELQRRLNSLGFDAGKVDGVFGPDTLAAVLDFQSNRRMAEDGIAGRQTVSEIELMARATRKDGRESVRERHWLATLPMHLAGQRVYVDAFCRNDQEAAGCWEAAVEFGRVVQGLGANAIYSRSADTSPPEEIRASRANRLGTDFVVSFADARGEEPAVFFFSSQHSHSSAGEKVAAAVADAIGIASAGRAIPMLTDTRPPAIVVATTPMNGSVGRRVAAGIRRLFSQPDVDRLA